MVRVCPFHLPVFLLVCNPLCDGCVMPDSSSHLYTAWHPLLIILLRYVLPGQWYELLSEVQLTLEPQRADAIIIRRLYALEPPPQLRHLRSILDDLRDHNLIHFKGATDELEASDVFQILTYITQWMNLQGLTDPSVISLRVVASEISPRFLKQVTLMGGSLNLTDLAGVYDGNLGVFHLRVIATAIAYDQPGEHELFPVSSAVLKHPDRAPLDILTTDLYYLFAQSIVQLRKDPKRRPMKDEALVQHSIESITEKMLSIATVEQKLRGLKPEDRLRGLKPEEILRGLKPEDRLRGLKPEEQLLGLKPEDRLRGLKPEEQLLGLKPEDRLRGLKPEDIAAALPPAHVLLALPDAMLAQLPESLISELPEEVQRTIRARIAR
jgi:hypothetical protein